MSLTQGVNIIKQSIVNMPQATGVYTMIDKNGVTLYVGKAKNLVNRVTNYTHPQRSEYRIQSMISQVVKVDFITTTTEAEALLLEANMIKKLAPKYNILLKDDKSFPYILLTTMHDYPRITKHRGAQKIKGEYFGPFSSAGSVNKSIADLQKAFLLRPCTDSFFNNRKRACIEYQIKRCSAPCVDKITKEDYRKLVQQATDFLRGKSRNIQKQLIELMENASEQQDYEKAAIFRDRIKALNQIQTKQTISINTLKDADIIALHSDGGESCVQLFFFRAGQNLGGKSYFLQNSLGKTDSEILETFISQFYNNSNIPPKELLLCQDTTNNTCIEHLLASFVKHKVKILVPKAGDKKKIIQNAKANAKSALQQRILHNSRQSKLLAEVQKLFNLTTIPQRIEVYDNSHISGTNAIGAMIVTDNDGFNKKAYRRFNIKNHNITPGDDYAMMREVLTRRFKRLKQEHPEKQQGIWPDLVLLDGGAGHLSVAIEVFTQLELYDDIVFACISKGPDRNAGREQFHMPGRDAFTLPHNDKAMYYLQTIRDEAHRFAIGSHRAKRAKTINKSALDEIEGIGSNRKKLLLQHFGSADSVRSASVEEIANINGINKSIAQKVFNHFH